MKSKKQIGTAIKIYENNLEREVQVITRARYKSYIEALVWVLKD